MANLVSWNWWTSGVALNTQNINPIFGSQMEPGDFILTIISLFVLVAWILSILFILWGGLLLILSWWKDDKIKPAINTIRYAIIGVIITVVAIFVFPILWGLLWIDVEKYAKPSRIFAKIEEIWNNVFGTTTRNWTYTPWSNSGLDDFPDDFSDL